MSLEVLWRSGGGGGSCCWGPAPAPVNGVSWNLVAFFGLVMGGEAVFLDLCFFVCGLATAGLCGDCRSGVGVTACGLFEVVFFLLFLLGLPPFAGVSPNASLDCPGMVFLALGGILW